MKSSYLEGIEHMVTYATGWHLYETVGDGRISQGSRPYQLDDYVEGDHVESYREHFHKGAQQALKAIGGQNLTPLGIDFIADQFTKDYFKAKHQRITKNHREFKFFRRLITLALQSNTPDDFLAKLRQGKLYRKGKGEQYQYKVIQGPPEHPHVWLRIK